MREVESSSKLGGIGIGSSSTQLMNLELRDFQSIDIEILLSYLAIDPLSLCSMMKTRLRNSEDDPDLSRDEMMDSKNEAFVDLPCCGKSMHKSTDLRL